MLISKKLKYIFIVSIFYLSLINMAYSQGVVSGGTYKIVARHSGKVLEVEGADFSTPTLVINTTSLPIGYTIINTPSREMSYNIAGYGLTPASGDITITAPDGFQVSKTSGLGFVSSLTLPYTGVGLLETTIYARLVPTEVKSYSGDITNAGGGATTQNVAVSGVGIDEPSPSAPIGFGQHTTGGEGGTEVTVSNTADFLDYISRSGKYIIQVSDTIKLYKMHFVLPYPIKAGLV